MSPRSERIGRASLAVTVVVLCATLAATISLVVLTGGLSAWFALRGGDAGVISGVLLPTATLVQLALALALPPGVALGFVFARRRRSLAARGARAIVKALAVVPTGLLGVACARLLGLSSILMLAPIAAAIALPTIVSATEGALGGALPDLEDTALALGASRAQVLFRVTLPALLATLAASLVRAGLRVAGESALFALFAARHEGSATLPLAPFVTTTEAGAIGLRATLVALLVLVSLVAVAVASIFERRAAPSANAPGLHS